MVLSRRFAIALFASLVMVVPAASVLVVAGEGAAEGESVLRIGFLQKIDSLNPLMGGSDTAWMFYGLVYDTPQCVDGQMNIVGNLCTRAIAVPSTDPDMIANDEPYGSVWEYTVANDAKWHDGEPFTVDDLAFNLNLNADNYESMWANQPFTYFMSYAEVIDEETVRVHFYDRISGEPTPAAYGKILGIPMLPKHKLGDMSPSELAFSWSGVFDGDDVPLVGTGPFMAQADIYQSWQDGGPITLVRNPDYHWGAEKGEYVKFDKIVMRFYEAASAMEDDLKAGVLDVTQLPPDNFEELEAGIDAGYTKGIATYSGLRCTQYFTEVAVNMNLAGPNPSRLDPVIRQALAKAMNKEYIADTLYLGYAEPGSTLISPVNPTWHYEPTSSEMLTYDIGAANEMLEAAGYRYTTDSPRVRVCSDDSLAVRNGWATNSTTLSYDMVVRTESPEERVIAAYLESQWRSVGVDMDYTIVDESDLGPIAYSYAYDMIIWYWSSDIDPNYQLFCQSSLAWSGWSDNKYYNASYDANYIDSVHEMDRVVRKTYTDNCQRIHYEDAAYMILAYPYQTYAWRTDTFTGWGDWSEEPGRSIDNFWSGNPLWFDLEPVKPGTSTMMYVAIGVASAGAVAVPVIFFHRRRRKVSK